MTGHDANRHVNIGRGESIPKHADQDAVSPDSQTAQYVAPVDAGCRASAQGLDHDLSPRKCLTSGVIAHTARERGLSHEAAWGKDPRHKRGKGECVKP